MGSSNKYLSSMLDMMQTKYTPKDEKLKDSEWMQKNTTLRGRKFSFDRYPFQLALVDDENLTSICVKPSQVGVSEIYQRSALTKMRRNPHRKMIYAYPDDMMRQKNVQTRVHPLAEQPAFMLEEESKPIRSIDLVQLGSSFLYMTGSKVSDATSTDADAVYLDEYDLHDMATAALFISRMQNSDWKLHRKFSTPTWEGYGIAGEYNRSDQTSYHIKCDTCNRWQFPMFTPEFIEVPGLPSDFNDLLEIDQETAEHFNLDIEGSYVCCHHCRSRLDLGRTDNRNWVTKSPSRTSYLRGWKINPFSTSTRPPKDLFHDLWTYKTNNNIKGFKNSSLGEAEETGSNRLQEADIRACLGNRNVPAIDRNRGAWVGIDMGHTCHIMVAHINSLKDVQVVRMLRVPLGKLYDTVKDILGTYRVIGGACDRHPESLAANTLREISDGKIIPCEYRGQKEINPVKSPENQEVLYAQINRTQMIDAAAAQIRGKQIQFNGFEILSEEIVTQYRNMIRDESTQEKEAVWKKLDNNDHFFHAAAFLVAGYRIKEFIEAVDGPKSSVIAIAGASVGGYTPSLLGNSKSGNKPWHSQSLLR